MVKNQYQSSLTMNPYLPFRAKRLLLRPITPSDLPKVRELLNDPKLYGRRYIPKHDHPFPLTEVQLQEVFEEWSKGDKSQTFLVEEQTNGELVGHTSFNWWWDPHQPFIDVVIYPLHQRKRYGTEVAVMVINYLFRNSVAHNIGMAVADWNEGGRLFIESIGFQQAGVERRTGIRDGHYVDDLIYDILRPEWLARLNTEEGL